MWLCKSVLLSITLPCPISIPGVIFALVFPTHFPVEASGPQILHSREDLTGPAPALDLGICLSLTCLGPLKDPG